MVTAIVLVSLIAVSVVYLFTCIVVFIIQRPVSAQEYTDFSVDAGRTKPSTFKLVVSANGLLDFRFYGTKLSNPKFRREFFLLQIANLSLLMGLFLVIVNIARG